MYSDGHVIRGGVGMSDGWDAPRESCLEATWDVRVSLAEVELLQCLAPCLWAIWRVGLTLSRLEDMSGLHGLCRRSRNICERSRDSLLCNFRVFAICNIAGGRWY